jgi:hypothetical protein
MDSEYHIQLHFNGDNNIARFSRTLNSIEEYITSSGGDKLNSLNFRKERSSASYLYLGTSLLLSLENSIRGLNSRIKIKPDVTRKHMTQVLEEVLGVLIDDEQAYMVVEQHKMNLANIFTSYLNEMIKVHFQNAKFDTFQLLSDELQIDKFRRSLRYIDQNDVLYDAFSVLEPSSIPVRAYCYSSARCRIAYMLRFDEATPIEFVLSRSNNIKPHLDGELILYDRKMIGRPQIRIAGLRIN